MVIQILHRLPAHWSHWLSNIFLQFRSFFISSKQQKWSSFYWRNLSFANPLGTAGGLDKSAKFIKGWWTYAPGFIEVGTVTPLPQKAHQGIVLKRCTLKKALWNYMGFPNSGCLSVKKRLQKLKKPYFTPIFISIAKNRQTPLDQSIQDYLLLIKKLHQQADAFVINISSPNTSQLRTLFKENFKSFLKQILNIRMQIKDCPPILLKTNPDVTNNDFLDMIQASERLGIDGWIVCNSTTKRNNLNFPQHGGVSGQPLAEKSKKLLQLLVSFLGDRKKDKLIVSCGGVMSEQDVVERLQMGADLVQVYSALVFQGPQFFKKSGQFYLSQQDS